MFPRWQISLCIFGFACCACHSFIGSRLPSMHTFLLLRKKRKKRKQNIRKEEKKWHSFFIFIAYWLVVKKKNIINNYQPMCVCIYLESMTHENDVHIYCRVWRSHVPHLTLLSASFQRNRLANKPKQVMCDDRTAQSRVFREQIQMNTRTFS